MKKIILTLFLALMATTGLYAQQISVVSTDGSTSLYRTFPEAIKGAVPGSVIYLPGGGFSIDDSVKITKKLTIIGIGHYNKSGNVDGVTTISGNLWFNEGSSGSSVMGCYITGNVNIGDGGAAVSDVLIKYCNLNSVQVKNNTCMDVAINQNYIRNGLSANNAKVGITNNVVFYIKDVNGVFISNNVITRGYLSGNYYHHLYGVYNSVITGNIFLKSERIGSSSTSYNNSALGNMGWTSYSIDEKYINMDGINNDAPFVNYNNKNVSPTSNFHFTEAYSQYENQVGIYAGTGFNDQQIAPVPYIVAKRVDEQTDASGKLNVKIRVKAGE